jgi:hypothetical protein
LETIVNKIESKSSAKTQAALPAAAGAGSFPTAMTVSLDRGMQMLKEWQVFMQAGADLMSDNAKATATDLQAFSACRSPEEFSRASATFGETLASRWLESGQKLARLSTDYAARRYLSPTPKDQPREG